ncbi:toll/interleukin-1 receptor domain-containing protein [Kineococcus indalonis]|uniref:toll/interleukin-1 receptor domain-containing protein n=1 Tax=Kineococcus indalonis TaxID=2696566 RepID=UPI0014125DDB|nr:toll/interleukin-1 receptor domain-containing protein [Kineococcus indalonis]NAZ84588.1 TIR domain-containing protein [Kineococcus indalonis]
MAATADAPHALISYVGENIEAVERLHGLLEKAGIPVWRDQRKLRPGMDWKQEIVTAIRSGAFAFLPCFSKELSERDKTVMNEELTIAVEEFRSRAPGKPWMFPVRLDDTPLPYWDLGAGRTLETLQYVDLFGDNYAEEAVRLVTAVRAAMGLDTAAAVDVTRAVVDEANAERRPSLLRDATKELLLDPARRIQLDDLVMSEARRVVQVINDEETTRYTGTSEHLAVTIAAAQVAQRLWSEVEPFCWSLQVAVRYISDPSQLRPWTAALQAMTAGATVIRGGYETIEGTRYIPALAATFTGALAAVAQQNWTAFKALTLETTAHSPYEVTSARPVIELVSPYKPFPSHPDDVAQLLAYSATTGEDFASIASTLRRPGGRPGLYTPPADWLHAVLRPIFEEQFVDAESYAREFDRTEVMLGLVSQQVAHERYANDPERSWLNHSSWFGRSTWRGRRARTSAVDDIAAELASQGQSWAPLRAGLFNGSQDEAEAAITAYAEHFQRMRDSRF